MKLTLAQLLSAAHALAPYEDEYDPATAVILSPYYPDTEITAELDGITYRVREDGALLDAQGKASGE